MKIADSVKFYIEEEPVAKMRPRFSSSRTYNPQKALEQRLKFIFALQKREQNYEINPVAPIEARLIFGCGVPKSSSKKRLMMLLDTFKITRPDLDNYDKFYLDVLNGIAYKDDSQIVKCTSIKKYVRTPFVSLEFTPTVGNP